MIASKLKISAALALAFSATSALAQSAPSNPAMTYGFVPTVGNWNSWFSQKQDALGFTPLNQAGGSLTGTLLTAAPTTAAPGLILSPGVAPSAPPNGAIWATSAGLFIQVSGATIGPLAAASSGSFAATTPITVAISGGLVTYAISLGADFTTSGSALALASVTGTGSVVKSASPALTGSPTAPTQTTADTSADLATDAFVHNVVTSSGVSSFNSRTGAVVPASGDYTTQQLTSNASGTPPACGSGKIGEVCALATVGGSNTVTFTNGSANIGWATATPAVGQAVSFTTTGALPTNFSTLTTYFVVSVVSTTIQVSATPGGAAISAGSAGSGTQSASQAGYLTSGSWSTVEALTLGAGDWHCTGQIGILPGTTGLAGIGIYMSSVNNATPTTTSPSLVSLAVAFTGTNEEMLSTATNVSLSSSGFFYLEAEASIGSGILQDFGNFQCFQRD